MNTQKQRGSSFEKEFKDLFEHYYSPFCLYANRFIDDMDISKDIVSDVFASLWQEQERVVLKKETALAYLKTCVKNKSLNYLKHINCRWEHIEYVLSQPADYGDSPDHVLNLEELYDLLNTTLSKLPPEYKTVFVQSVMKGKSHEEIAEEMQISLRSVNRYKQKVLGQLKLDLSDYFPAILVAILAMES